MGEEQTSPEQRTDKSDAREDAAAPSSSSQIASALQVPASQSAHSRRSRSPSAHGTQSSLLPPVSEGGLTASDLIAHQALLESQAREAIPFSYTRAACTYDKGYIRQPLWACRDCNGINVCAGCSIGCHAEHDLVELFAKRNSRCDCGAVKGDQGDTKPCNLRSAPLNFVPENVKNTYGKNHDGHFCYCAKGWTYDPLEEEETMFQCLVCEEWFHETCTSLRPSAQREQAGPSDSSSNENDINRTAAASAVHTSNDAPPPLIAHESFDSLICDLCVRSHPILHHYLAQPQWGICLEHSHHGQIQQSNSPTEISKTSIEFKDNESRLQRFAILGLEANRLEYEDWKRGIPAETSQVATSGLKRELSPIAESDQGGQAGTAAQAEDSPASKKIKLEPSNGAESASDPLAPPQNSCTSKHDVDADSKVDQARVPVGERSPKCRLPSIHPLVQEILRSSRPSLVKPHANNPGDLQRSTDRLDVFLDEGGEEEIADGNGSRGWRKRLCRCSTCLASIAAHPELASILQEEETYEPPASPGGGEEDIDNAARGAAAQDDDASSATSSSYDRAMSALSSLPRAQTLEALQGYTRLREALFEHLKPFAREGRMVDEESVRNFFDEWRERQRGGE